MMDNSTLSNNDLEVIREAVREAVEELLDIHNVFNAESSSERSGPRTMSVVEAAKVLGLSKSAMWSAVWKGSIASIRIGGRVLISKATIDQLLSVVPNDQGGIQ